MDWLELANPKPKFPAAAKYYENTVDGPEDGGQEFTFDYVDPLSHTFRRLFGNIIEGKQDGEVAIRTRDQMPFRKGSYVVLASGKTFQIIQCQEHFSAASKQALRIFPVPPSVEYVIRMVEQSNVWGVQ